MTINGMTFGGFPEAESFLGELPALDDVYDTARALRFQEEVVKSRTSVGSFSLLKSVYALLSTSDLVPRPDWHDTQMIIYSLQYNPSLIPEVASYVDRLLAPEVGSSGPRRLWEYILEKFKPVGTT